MSFGARNLMQRSFDAKRRSTAVVVEFSEKGVGLGIEAAYASALDIPIFVLLRSEAELSTTLEGISTEAFRYTDNNPLNTAAARVADEIGRVSVRPQRLKVLGAAGFRGPLTRLHVGR